MFGLKIFVRVQTFRRVPPVLPCNFCHPDCRYVLFLVQSLLLCLWNFIASRLSKIMTKAGNIQFLFKLHIYSNPFNLWIQFQRTAWASLFPKWHLASNPIFLKIQIPVLILIQIYFLRFLMYHPSQCATSDRCNSSSAPGAPQMTHRGNFGLK